MGPFVSICYTYQSDYPKLRSSIVFRLRIRFYRYLGAALRYCGLYLVCILRSRSCGACIEQKSCGFCYYKTADGLYTNSSCLTTKESLLTSIYGSCSNISSEAMEPSYVWAYDYCPTSYSWMAILGIILYLACFSPGLYFTSWLLEIGVYYYARTFCLIGSVLDLSLVMTFHSMYCKCLDTVRIEYAESRTRVATPMRQHVMHKFYWKLGLLFELKLFESKLN